MSDDARRYADARYRLMLVDMAAGAAWLLAWQASGLSRAVAEWWQTWLAWPPGVLAGCLAVLWLAHTAAFLPLRWYGSFTLEHRFGLSRQTPGAWWRRQAKQLAIGGVIGLLTVEGLYAIFHLAPRAWPVWATVGWVGLSVLLARVFPTLLLPLFYKTAPLQDAALASRLAALCARAQVPVLGVFRFQLGAETRKANAALAGVGKTRRVLLADTLLEQFTPEEIEGVLAHEVAHHRYHHITKGLVLSAVGSWLAFLMTAAAAQRWLPALGLDGLADPAGVPALLLWFSLLGLLGMPLQNAVSRHFEWECDRFAVRETPPQVFASALRRLGTLNLADPHPPRWITWLFYDHPPITDRIRAAEHAG